MKKSNPFRCFKTSPEIIRLGVMMYIRFPLSHRNVEDVLHERGIDICPETVGFWWNRFGSTLTAEIRKRRVKNHAYSNWRWHCRYAATRGTFPLTSQLWEEGDVNEQGSTRDPTQVALTSIR